MAGIRKKGFGAEAKKPSLNRLLGTNRWSYILYEKIDMNKVMIRIRIDSLGRIVFQDLGEEIQIGILLREYV